jgi:hypothetical protein
MGAFEFGEEVPGLVAAAQALPRRHDAPPRHRAAPAAQRGDARGRAQALDHHRPRRRLQHQGVGPGEAGMGAFEFGEEVPGLVAAAQALDHPVEGRGDRVDLVAGPGAGTSS